MFTSNIRLLLSGYVVSYSLWPHELQPVRIPCPPLSPSLFPSIRVFSNEVTLHIRWPNCWEFQLRHQAFQWILRVDFLQNGLVGSPCSARDSQESSPTVQKLQFFGAQPSSQSNSHIHTWPLEKTIALTRQTFVGKVMSLLFNMLSRLVITFLPRASVF